MYTLVYDQAITKIISITYNLNDISLSINIDDKLIESLNYESNLWTMTSFDFEIKVSTIDDQVEIINVGIIFTGPLCNFRDILSEWRLFYDTQTKFLN